MGRGKRRVFRASEVQRSYRALLDEVKEEGPVQILDSDGTVLGIERWEEMELDRRFRALAGQVGQFMQAYARHHSEPASEWTGMTPFPWSDTLDSEEMAEFASEIQSLVFEVANRGELVELENALRIWRSTANTYRAPEILAAMLDEDEGERGEVFPPEHYGYHEEAESAPRGSSAR